MFLLIFIITIFTIITIIILHDYLKTKEVEQGKIQLEKIQSQQIKVLAEDFIKKTITHNKTELDSDDYKKFYELIKSHHIEIKNNYAVDVPYQVRCILYETYVKKYNELANLHEAKISELQRNNTETTQEEFKTFLDKVKPYSIKYIKTLLPACDLPSEINKNFQENEISAFAYLIENNYQIKIPIIESISYDTLYLSENTLQSIRNIRYKHYATLKKEEIKLRIVDFVLSYYYALEIYSIFEDKFVSNNPDLKQDIVSLIQAYIKIFNDDLLYIDLLLEYIQKYKIEISKPLEEDFVEIELALDLYEETLKYDIITNSDYSNTHASFEDIMDCTDKNWKYFYLLSLTIKKLKTLKIQDEAKNMLANMQNTATVTTTLTDVKYRRNAAWWMSLDPWTFEKEIADLFKMQGYNVKVTRGSGDGGVDLFLTKDNCNIIVQCKQYTHPVPPEPIRALWGIKDDFGADKVILIATNGITSSGKRFINNKPEYIVYTLDDIVKMSMQ